MPRIRDKNKLTQMQAMSRQRHMVVKVVEKAKIIPLLEEREILLEKKESLSKELSDAREKINQINGELENNGIENYMHYRPDAPFIPDGVTFKEDELQRLKDYIDNHAVFYDAQDSKAEFLNPALSSAAVKKHRNAIPIPKKPIKKKKENPADRKSNQTGNASKKKLDFSKLARFATGKAQEAPAPRRLPGVYSNRSQYGIATEMLMEQLWEENEAKGRKVDKIRGK